MWRGPEHCLVARIVGFDGKLAFDSSKPDGTPRKMLDIGQLQAFNWMPKTGLEQGIALSYVDFLKFFPKYSNRSMVC